MGEQESAPEVPAFERRFGTAARRVLQRHGVPEDQVEAEIFRLRQHNPSFSLPTLDEIERMNLDD